MSQNGGLIYADFYRTVFNCYAEDYMFSGEFFDKAKADADALTSQYLLGCYTGRYTSIDEIKNVYKACQYHLNKLYFTPELMKKVTDYIRKNYPGMTIREFYRKITGEDLKGDYVITDTKIELYYDAQSPSSLGRG